MSEHKIPDAAVEAAAKRLAGIGGQPHNWANYRTPARAALEAAAPHMITRPPLVQEFGPMDAAKYQPPGHGPIH